MSAESGESGESNDAIDYNELPPEKRRELCGILENFGVFEGIGEISQAMSTYDATKHLRPNEELPAALVNLIMQSTQDNRKKNFFDDYQGLEKALKQAGFTPNQAQQCWEAQLES
ncbi:MAG: hypothetical protein ACD_28C00133G0006 [uncultured bacterium]|nr:MAG: hypothetical protein ACD_28C00133G0006 [uncultured bacterium]